MQTPSPAYPQYHPHLLYLSCTPTNVVLLPTHLHHPPPPRPHYLRYPHRWLPSNQKTADRGHCLTHPHPWLTRLPRALPLRPHPHPGSLNRRQQRRGTWVSGSWEVHRNPRQDLFKAYTQVSVNKVAKIFYSATCIFFIKWSWHRSRLLWVITAS